MNEKRLPDGELTVMQALWDCKVPAARRDIEEILFPEHPMAMTTLLTFLTRLAEKEYIKIEKTGRTSFYSPLISRQEYLANQSQHFIKKLCGGNISLFANALCDSGLSQDELKELRKLLEERRI